MHQAQCLRVSEANRIFWSGWTHVYAVYKGLLISHSILEGVAQNKPVGSRTECPGIGPLLSGRRVCSYFNQFPRVLTKKKEAGLAREASGTVPTARRFPSPMQFFNGVGLMISGCHKCLFINFWRFWPKEKRLYEPNRHRGQCPQVPEPDAIC